MSQLSQRRDSALYRNRFTPSQRSSRYSLIVFLIGSICHLFLFKGTLDLGQDPGRVPTRQDGNASIQGQFLLIYYRASFNPRFVVKVLWLVEK